LWKQISICCNCNKYIKTPVWHFQYYILVAE
jgi:hypothetical protein